MDTIINWIEQLAGICLPQSCCLCRKRVGFREYLCGDCHKQLPWNHSACRQCALPLEAGSSLCGLCATDPPAFSKCIAPFRYEPPVATFIVQLKFQQQLRYSRVLGHLLAEYIRTHSQSLPQCLIPVPLHNQRLRQRGFNQALEIAKPLSKIFNIPLLRNHCVRRKPTLPQSQLSANARRRNIRSAFSIHRPIAFQHVAIVDDVMTTGQTVRALSQLLAKHGVKTIEVWCCARVPA